MGQRCKKRLPWGLAFFLVASMSFAAHASPLDLSTWTSEAWEFYDNKGKATWSIFGSDSTRAVQQSLAGPSLYLNNVSQTNYALQYSLRVLGPRSTGIVGFIFGYQDQSHFYLIDWRNFNSPDVGIGLHGLAIKKFFAPSPEDLDLSDFKSSVSTDHMTVLASQYGFDRRWLHARQYEFSLAFDSQSFHISVGLFGKSNPLWDVTIDDDSYISGQFGFYTFNQQGAMFYDFKQQGGVPVPEPPTYLLFGLSLFALFGLKAQRHGSHNDKERCVLR